MTQCEKLLNHLRTKGPITTREAIRQYGILRPAARIKDLRDQGHGIHTEMVEVSAADGSTAEVARYSLTGQQRLSMR